MCNEYFCSSFPLKILSTNCLINERSNCLLLHAIFNLHQAPFAVSILKQSFGKSLKDEPIDLSVNTIGKIYMERTFPVDVSTGGEKRRKNIKERGSSLARKAKWHEVKYNLEWISFSPSFILFSPLYSLMKRLKVKHCKFEMQSIKETAWTSSGGNGHQWPLTVESLTTRTQHFFSFSFPSSQLSFSFSFS